MGVGEELGDDGGLGENFVVDGAVGIAEGGDLAFLLRGGGISWCEGARDIEGLPRWGGEGRWRGSRGGVFEVVGWGQMLTGLIFRNHSSRGWLRSMWTSS